MSMQSKLCIVFTVFVWNSPFNQNYEISIEMRTYNTNKKKIWKVKIYKYFIEKNKHKIIFVNYKYISYNMLKCSQIEVYMKFRTKCELIV